MKIKKILPWVFVIVVSAAGFSGWLFLKMFSESSAYYTEKDKLDYAFYTPELLKKMPRISKDYSFEYANISGPQAFVFAVRYEGTTDTKKIEEYLASEGFEIVKPCGIREACWQSKRTIDEVTVNTLSSPDAIWVQVYRSGYKKLENSMPD